MKKIIVIGLIAMVTLTGCGKEAPKAEISKPTETIINETVLTENVITESNSDASIR